MSDADAGQRQGARPEPGLLLEYPVSRRAVLRAGLIGAAVVACRRTLNPAPALAAAGRSAQPQPAYGDYDLNQNWLFGGPYVSGAEQPGYADSDFANVTLPHTVVPLSWGDWDPTTWQNVWIYRRHIALAGVANARVFADFDGAMTNATVYLGGRQLGLHQGGYLPFSVELTGGLVAGDNVLAVVLDGRWLDVPPSGASRGPSSVDFLQPAGIYRDVGLRVVPETFISNVFAVPSNVLSARPTVAVTVTIDTASVPATPVQITATLTNGTTQIAKASGTVTLTATGPTVTELTIKGFGGVQLWSPENPALYQVNVTINAGGVPHTATVNVGFREASFEPDGFHLNGQRYEIFGLNRHQLFPYLGMAAPGRLQRRDAQLLRSELNCNMVRCSHYPQSPAFLDACDELGLMVWEEPPGWQYLPAGDTNFQQIVLQNVQDMVVRDRNRPSVILWATRLNETGNNPALAPFYAQTRNVAQAYDGSRQTAGTMTTESTTGWSEDVFAYDDYHPRLAPPPPGVPFLISEAVGAITGAPLYRWVDSGATLALQGRLHAQIHQDAHANTHIAGVLAWAGIDYASLVGGFRIWHNVKWPGVIDTFRVPKPGAAFYQSQVDPSVRPVIIPMFFWDFGPSSPANGPGPNSIIATNCDRLELYLAGTHFATAYPDTQDFPNLLHPPVLVDLTPGGAGSPDLQIDGYVAGQKVATVQMSSDTTKDRLALSVDDAQVVADGSDATRFTFRASDAYGNQRPYVGGQVSLALGGPGALIVQSPFAFDVYGGVGGGFIRSQPGATGLATLTAVHPTLGQAQAQVTFTPPNPTATIAKVRHLKRIKTAATRAALARLLSAQAMSIGTLLSHSGYSATFDAPTAGQLTLDWYDARTPSTLLASAQVKTRRAGLVTLQVRLTPAGAKLLRSSSHRRVSVQATFTPRGGATVSSTKVIDLRR